MSERIYAILGCECIHVDTDEEKCIKIPAVFETKKDLEYYEDSFSYYLIGVVNSWLVKNGYKKWIMNGVVEINKFVEKNDKINYMVISEKTAPRVSY